MKRKAEQKEEMVSISVRNLIEFLLCSGDIDQTHGGKIDANTMQEGARIHRKIQKDMGSDYRAEVTLSHIFSIEREDISFSLLVEGRADGIIENKNGTTIDEIKSTYRDLTLLQSPILIHKYQAMCYAYLYSIQKTRKEFHIQLTYCQIETEEIKRFIETISLKELERWFMELIEQYAKWAAWSIKWKSTRDCSIKKISFPFAYRDGQKGLASGVYKTILREKRLFIEAPTGVGKTVSTIFPTIKAIGEGLADKFFYLTAKTITRTVAEETIALFLKQGLRIKTTTLTAKEKLCILEKPDCNPISCPRAKGHYDRINEAVYELLLTKDQITRECILEHAQKHKVCPFEMSLDISLFMDAVICDYNYVFDPNIYLKRFFSYEEKKNYVLLIDEAHNLVDRAREMYSAALYKESFLEIKRQIKLISKPLAKKLETCNHDLLLLKRECEEFCVVTDIQNFILHLMRLLSELEEFLQTGVSTTAREEVLDLYFEIRHFLNMYDLFNEKYCIYTDYNEKEEFRIRLQCMNPSDNLNLCLNRVKASIFFSATLLPIQYYKEHLAGREEDYAIYAPSPFHTENRILLFADDVSTKFTRRTEQEYKKIEQYIRIFIQARRGNYLVFFPSYQMLSEFAIRFPKEENFEYFFQTPNMTEQEKELFLEQFVEEEKTKVGFCIMGGIFGEGIDLRNDRLIGAVIVGTGLPMICKERELFRSYYEENGKNGFDYAYLYNGMNKVLQSVGRVIRTDKDKGAILLLDERFLTESYKKLFPIEWFPYYIIHQNSIKKVLEDFWNVQSSDL